LWTGFIWLRIGTGGEFFGYGNELWDSVKGGEVLDQLSDY